jgi:hypothetical protein
MTSPKAVDLYSDPFDFTIDDELPNWQTYRSGRGTTMDVIKSGLEVPPGVILFEDPPRRSRHPAGVGR